MTESEEWRLLRCGKFTASEISKLLAKGTRPMSATEIEFEKAVAKEEKRTARKTVTTTFGDTARTYMKEVLREMLTGIPKFTTTSFAMQRGLDLEPQAAALLKEKYPDLVYYGTTNPKFIDFNEMSGGSPDGETKKLTVEIKCPEQRFFDYLSISMGFEFGSEIPYEGTFNEWLLDYDKDYYCQIQFNMMCAKKQGGIFCVYDPDIKTDHNLVILPIQPDVPLQEEIGMRIEAATDLLTRQLDMLGLLN